MGKDNQPCSQCGAWKNPAPVAVLVVPVDSGVLVIRRNIPPVREVREEAGVVIDAAGVRHARTVSPPDGRVVLIFGVAPPLTSGDLRTWEPNPEVIERLLVHEPVDLAFPTHTDVLRAWFAGELNRG